VLKYDRALNYASASNTNFVTGWYNYEQPNHNICAEQADVYAKDTSPSGVTWQTYITENGVQY
jgi:hypothetical protein